MIRSPDWLNECVAKCVNAELGRWESFWAPGSYSCVALVMCPVDRDREGVAAGKHRIRLTDPLFFDECRVCELGFQLAGRVYAQGHEGLTVEPPLKHHMNRVCLGVRFFWTRDELFGSGGGGGGGGLMLTMWTGLGGGSGSLSRSGASATINTIATCATIDAFHQKPRLSLRG